MEQKRSIGVTIFGILIIASTLLSLPYLFDPKSSIEFFIKPLGVILYVLTFPLTALEIVLGVNILKLREWARKGLLTLSILYLVSMFIIPRFQDKNYEQCQLQNLRAIYQQGATAQNGGYVLYSINTKSGEPILMRVDYALPQRSIQNVGFHLTKMKPDGVYRYEIISKEGEKILIDFFQKNNRLNNLRLDTAFRPLPENRQSDTILTLLSADKKEIIVTFSWNADGSIKNVKVKPSVDELTNQEKVSAQNLSPEQKERLQRLSEDLPVLIIKFVTAFFYGAFFLLYVLTIFFFTRPKVREQFK